MFDLNTMPNKLLGLVFLRFPSVADQHFLRAAVQDLMPATNVYHPPFITLCIRALLRFPFFPLIGGRTFLFEFNVTSFDGLLFSFVLLKKAPESNHLLFSSSFCLFSLRRGPTSFKFSLPPRPKVEFVFFFFLTEQCR